MAKTLYCIDIQFKVQGINEMFQPLQTSFNLEGIDKVSKWVEERISKYDNLVYYELKSQIPANVEVLKWEGKGYYQVINGEARFVTTKVIRGILEQRVIESEEEKITITNLNNVEADTDIDFS